MNLSKNSSRAPVLPRTNTKSQCLPVTANYFYMWSIDRKLHFHETLLISSNSASSPFTTEHPLRPPCLPVLQHMLFAECYPSQRLHTGISRSTYRRQHRILLIELFMLWLRLVSRPFLHFPSPFLPTGTSCLHCLFNHHLFLQEALLGKTQCQPKLLQWVPTGLVLPPSQSGLKKVLCLQYTAVELTKQSYFLPPKHPCSYF